MTRGLSFSCAQQHSATHGLERQAAKRLHAVLMAAVTLLLLFPPDAALAAAMTEQSAPSEAQRVLAAEDEYVGAEIRRDEAVLQRLVDDRFAFNANDGTTMDKAAFIRSVLAMNMFGQAISERTVLVEGGLALVFGTAELRLAVAGKDDVISVLRYTATYVKRHGHWRMLALQMVPRKPK